MRSAGIRGYIGRAFGPLITRLSLPVAASAAFVLAAAALQRIHMAITVDRVKYLYVLPLHGKAAIYNNMAEGRYIDTSTGPLYPLFLMLVRLFAPGGGLRAVFLLQGLATVLGAAAAGVTAMRLAERSAEVSWPAVPAKGVPVSPAAGGSAGTVGLRRQAAGLAALILVAAYPPFIIYSLVVLPLIFCVTVVFLLMLVLSAGGENGEAPGPVVPAILSAVAFMLHPVMVFLFPGVLAAVRRRLVAAAVFLVLTAPWGIRNCVIAGRPVPVYESIAYEVAPARLFKARGGWQIIEGIYFNARFLMKKSYERAHMPIAFGTKRNNDHVLGYSYVAVALLGLAGMAAYAGRAGFRTLLPLISYAAVTILITTYTTRRRVILDPAMLVFAGITVAAILSRLLGLFRPRRNGALEEPP